MTDVTLPSGPVRFIGTHVLRTIYLSGSWDHVVTLVQNVPCGRSSAADSDLPSTHLLLWPMHHSGRTVGRRSNGPRVATLFVIALIFSSLFYVESPLHHRHVDLDPHHGRRPSIELEDPPQCRVYCHLCVPLSTSPVSTAHSFSLF